MDFPKRGDVYIANLDPTIGSEIKKTRPILVVSNDIGNQFSNTLTVVPLTSTGTKNQKIRLFEALVKKSKHVNLESDSKARADQVRTIDKRRLTRALGCISINELTEVTKALRIHLALD